MSDNTVETVLTQLVDGQAQVANGLAQLADGLRQAAAGQAQLVHGQTSLQSNVKTLLTNALALDEGQMALSKSHRALRVDLMARMDRLEDKITDMRGDITVNFGATEQVRRANSNTREELRAVEDHVGTMLLQIRRIKSVISELDGDP